MGNRIEFPHNNRMTQLFFEEAYDYILEKDQEKALDKIRMIYSYNKSAETVYLYSVIFPCCKAILQARLNFPNF